MNGQLNGFHEVFIEEGTFLFTSESVGEGHPGARPGGRALRRRGLLGAGEGRGGVRGGRALRVPAGPSCARNWRGGGGP